MLLGLDSSILCMCQAVFTYAWQALDPGRHWTQAGTRPKKALDPGIVLPINLSSGFRTNTNESWMLSSKLTGGQSFQLLSTGSGVWR